MNYFLDTNTCIYYLKGCRIAKMIRGMKDTKIWSVVGKYHCH